MLPFFNNKSKGCFFGGWGEGGISVLPVGHPNAKISAGVGLIRGSQ